MAHTSEPTRPVSRELARLGREHGIMSCYLDVAGRRQHASTESILAVLNILGVEIDRPEQAGELLRCGRDECRLRGLEPVYVAWDGRLPAITLELGGESPDARIAYALSGEGQTLEGVVEDDSLRQGEAAGAGRREVRIPTALEPGYYDLELVVGRRRLRSFVISSPTWAYHLGPRKEWGCFLPLYALRTQGDWGIGDLTGLRRFTQWVADWGAGAVGALPLYAAFLDELYEPSPYRPVSRLF